MLRIGDRKQFWSGLIFLCCGAFALWKLPAQIGTATSMGPGYFPMLVGICLILSGGSSMFLGIRSTEAVEVGRPPFKALAFSLVGVLLFAVLINRAGLAVSLACLILACCFTRLRDRPLEVLIIYAALLGLTWLVFIYFIQLPINVFW